MKQFSYLLRPSNIRILPSPLTYESGGAYQEICPFCSGVVKNRASPSLNYPSALPRTLIQHLMLDTFFLPPRLSKQLAQLYHRTPISRELISQDASKYRRCADPLGRKNLPAGQFPLAQNRREKSIWNSPNKCLLMFFLCFSLLFFSSSVLYEKYQKIQYSRASLFVFDFLMHSIMLQFFALIIIGYI